MKGEDWLGRVAGVRRWQRGDERAPHKPLLLLWALGRLQRTGSSKASYAEAEGPLAALLADYLPAGRKSSPAYPFHHLRSDGLWVVETADGHDPGARVSDLRASASGCFDPAFEAALVSEPALFGLVAHTILAENFPESLHGDICEAVGLDLEALDAGAVVARIDREGLRRRDPAFRERVLVAYEYRCAMCGFDGRLGTTAVGLDAAHVRWRAFGGPDDVANSLCLCSFHHKLFDRGAVGVTAGHEVAVSARFIGRGDSAHRLVLDLVGAPLHEPQPGMPPLAEEHRTWHWTEVFSTPPREPRAA